MSEIKYRKANSKDATAISLLWAEFFDYHFSVDPLYQRRKDSEKDIAELLLKAVDDENKFICVAECNESLIGYIWCEIDKKPSRFQNRFYGLVSDIAVSEKYRGKGIAKSLLKNGLTGSEPKISTILKLAYCWLIHWLQNSGHQAVLSLLSKYFAIN